MTFIIINKLTMIEEQFRDYTIKIGRNKEENDDLVRNAEPDDYWLHVSDYPSPHCIIINPTKKRIHQKILKHAAYLTKKYSKYSNIAKLDIDVTRIKFIETTDKKGLVNVSNIIKVIKA